MIAVDTNILVYAHREDSPWHEAAWSCVAAMAEGRDSWAIPWPCLHEFVAIATHPRIYAPPSPLAAFAIVLGHCLFYGVPVAFVVRATSGTTQP